MVVVSNPGTASYVLNVYTDVAGITTIPYFIIGIGLG